MERLSNYAASSVEALPNFLQVEAFSKLNYAIGKVNLASTHEVKSDNLNWHLNVSLFIRGASIRNSWKI